MPGMLRKFNRRVRSIDAGVVDAWLDALARTTRVEITQDAKRVIASEAFFAECASHSGEFRLVGIHGSELKKGERTLHGILEAGAHRKCTYAFADLAVALRGLNQSEIGFREVVVIHRPIPILDSMGKRRLALLALRHHGGAAILSTVHVENGAELPRNRLFVLMAA